MSYYIICQSDQNPQYYPDNAPCSFKTKLRQTLELNGQWEIALTEITLREEHAKDDTLYIYTNICGESVINGVNAPLLRRAVVPNNANTIFTPYYYLPVIKSEINEIEFNLETERGRAASHLAKPVTVVLHLTRLQAE